MRQIILHNIRSVYNVGSVFRTAEGAGVKKIYLSGYTPTPVDRFGRKRADISKVALGSEELVGWEKHNDINQLIELLKVEGTRVVAVEQAENSTDYRKFNEPESVAYIFGNEVEGLEKSVLKDADEIIEIPMKGKKESLNVSVAVGIILFRS